MRKTQILIIILLFLLVGCATYQCQDTSLDYIRCPHCLSFLTISSPHTDILQCIVCKNNFSYAEGKRHYNLYVEEYNKTVLPSQILAEEQATQGTLNRIHDIYQRNNSGQQIMQNAQKNIDEWNADWRKRH